MQKRIRYWISGLSALCLIAPAAIAVILVPRYSAFYKGVAVSPPPSTQSRPDAQVRQITLVAATTVVLAAFAVWLAFLWFGLFTPIHDMNTVVGSG